MTFGEYYPEYMAQKEVLVKRTTVSAYKLIWEAHLKAYLQDINIEDVKNSTLQKYVNAEVAKRGRVMKCIRDDITLAKNMIKCYCIANDLPLVTPIIIYPSKTVANTRKKRDKFTDEEVKLIVDFCRESKIHCYKAMALAALTGMRIGEVCGLKFSDFDFEKKTVSVNRTVGRIYEGRETTLYEQSPKSVTSIRTIPAPDWLLKYYQSYKELFNCKDDDFITTSYEVPFLEPRTMRSKFNAVLQKLGIEHKPFHSLRHSFASRLLISGVDARTTAELLGHSDVAMTLNVYSHSDDQAKYDAVKKACLDV